MGLLRRIRRTVKSAVKSTTKAIIKVHTNPVKAIKQGVKAVPGALKDGLAYTNPFDRKSLVQSTLGVVTKNIIKPITVQLAASHPVFSSIARLGRPGEKLLDYTQDNPQTSLVILGAVAATAGALGYYAPAVPSGVGVGTGVSVGAVTVPTTGVVGGTSVLGTLGSSLGVAVTGVAIREVQKQVDVLLGNKRDDDSPAPKRSNMMLIYVGGGVVALIAAVLVLRK